MVRLFFLFVIALIGFWIGKEKALPQKEPKFQPEKVFPHIENKSFAIVVYAHNQALWCERALRSIFEQDYDYYRVIFIDDGSIDGTAEKAKEYIVENNQENRAILIRNDTCLGPVASLYRVIDSCLDKEIVVPLDAKDWLAAPISLNRLNIAYQNPDVWIELGQSIEYPSYLIQDQLQTSFYAALFKQIKLEDLYANGHFAQNPDAYLIPLQKLADGRIRKLREPISFSNTACPVHTQQSLGKTPEYQPLSAFPKPQTASKADILIFSCDRPLQLYACLESIQRYITGFEKFSVLYRASNSDFAAAYEKVKNAFPLVEFLAQDPTSMSDFKSRLLKTAFESPAPYILLGVDDSIVKDFVDLKTCITQMEKTDAYGFYLRYGKNTLPESLPPSLPLSCDVYAWDIQAADDDWSFANSLELTLFKKEKIKNVFSKMKYKTPRTLQAAWSAPKQAIGLYFENSKLINIPMNSVEGTERVSSLSTEELLAKFNQGLKIDIEPLYKVANQSPEVDTIPEFVLR